MSRIVMDMGRGDALVLSQESVEPPGRTITCFDVARPSNDVFCVSFRVAAIVLPFPVKEPGENVTLVDLEESDSIIFVESYFERFSEKSIEIVELPV